MSQHIQPAACLSPQGPEFPNSTDGDHAPYGLIPPFDCGNETSMSGGCLFSIASDPHETVDLAAKMPARLAQLKERYSELRKTRLDQSDGPPPSPSLHELIHFHLPLLAPERR